MPAEDPSRTDNEVEANSTSSSSSDDENTGYTRQQKITLATVLVSQFCVMTSLFLPSPFLPKLVGIGYGQLKYTKHTL